VILVDTSIWIDHLRKGETKLTKLLQDGDVLAHPWVVGELALGHLIRRSEILMLLHNLPQVAVATDTEVLTLIDNHELSGLGIGYVDAQLVAATMLTPGARLWTRDRRLVTVANRCGIEVRGGSEP
jgi:predicted nucleic acid-binding protein